MLYRKAYNANRRHQFISHHDSTHSTGSRPHNVAEHFNKALTLDSIGNKNTSMGSRNVVTLSNAAPPNPTLGNSFASWTAVLPPQFRPADLHLTYHYLTNIDNLLYKPDANGTRGYILESIPRILTRGSADQHLMLSIASAHIARQRVDERMANDSTWYMNNAVVAQQNLIAFAATDTSVPDLSRLGVDGIETFLFLALNLAILSWMKCYQDCWLKAPKEQ